MAGASDTATLEQPQRRPLADVLSKLENELATDRDLLRVAYDASRATVETERSAVRSVDALTSQLELILNRLDQRLDGLWDARQLLGT